MIGKIYKIGLKRRTIKDDVILKMIGHVYKIEIPKKKGVVGTPEDRIAYRKNYYTVNKEMQFNCICGVVVKRFNISSHIKTMKHNYFINHGYKYEINPKNIKSRYVKKNDAINLMKSRENIEKSLIVQFDW